ncbi:PAR1 [Artemisia annua]|uniref:PAR1 n=1 Tax=Artemisia annua TaxID=35608 RepID=A0A2U1PPW0_ARTAN|nr:PAR1 [Artemisia annua]
MKFFVVLFFALSLFIHGSFGTIICEDLTKDNCSFAISSYGKRCVLEDYEGKKGTVEYQCRTSEVMVEIMSGYIETDECVRACGVNRNATGISSDALLDKNAIVTLCSPPCYQRCPNIVDLHFNLAVGEGLSLPDLCEQQRNHPDRAMIELLSSSFVADGPVGSKRTRLFSVAPAPFSI